MNRVFGIAVALGALVFTGHLASAQESVSRYRGFVLESTLESVVVTSGARAADVTTIHERPGKIQHLEWRAPYESAGSERTDPVDEIAFAFLDGALYQVVVSYDRDRTDGLTNRDIIDSLVTAYGVPVVSSTRTQAARPAAASSDAIVLAQWDTAAASLTLVRGTYSPQFQLILISKSLSTRARSAAREAVRLDAAEAPQRELDQRKKDAAEADAARDKARAANKAAFRP